MVWQPGETGNAAGASSRKPISDALRGLLTRNPEEPIKDKPKTNAQKLAIIRLNAALKGDKDAIRDVKEWVEGKASQAIIGGDENEPPVQVLGITDKDLINRYIQQKEEK